MRKNGVNMRINVIIFFKSDLLLKIDICIDWFNLVK